MDCGPINQYRKQLTRYLAGCSAAHHSGPSDSQRKKIKCRSQRKTITDQYSPSRYAWYLRLFSCRYLVISLAIEVVSFRILSQGHGYSVSPSTTASVYGGYLRTGINCRIFPIICIVALYYIMHRVCPLLHCHISTRGLFRYYSWLCRRICVLEHV